MAPKDMKKAMNVSASKKMIKQDKRKSKESATGGVASQSQVLVNKGEGIQGKSSTPKKNFSEETVQKYLIAWEKERKILEDSRREAIEERKEEERKLLHFDVLKKQTPTENDRTSHAELAKELLSDLYEDWKDEVSYKASFGFTRTSSFKACIQLHCSQHGSLTMLFLSCGIPCHICIASLMKGHV